MLLVVKVMLLLTAVGFVPKTAVTPLGKPEAASVTLPVNPPASVTVTVSVPLAPCAIDNVDAAGASVKLGDVPVVIVRPMLVEAVTVPLVPVIVTG